MQVQKVRFSKEANGLVPAGRYFEQLARDLRNANDEEIARQAKLDAEDARLEARYRRASASRSNTHVSHEVHAPM